MSGLGVRLVIYWQLFSLFAKASLLAFGSAVTILPAITDAVVNEYQWMSTEAVVRAYVLGQFVPGPNMVMATLVGYQVAGLAGAAASTFGMYIGPITLTSLVTALYYRHRQKSYVRRIEFALRPLVLGLVLAAMIRFLKVEMQGNLLAGCLIGLPVVWLHWHRKINAVVGLILIGAGWYAAFVLGFLQLG